MIFGSTIKLSPFRVAGLTAREMQLSTESSLDVYKCSTTTPAAAAAAPTTATTSGTDTDTELVLVLVLILNLILMLYC